MRNKSDFNYYAMRAVDIFQSIKVLEGPLGLSSTLKRHQPLVKWLKDYYREALQELEEDLALTNYK